MSDGISFWDAVREIGDVILGLGIIGFLLYDYIKRRMRRNSIKKFLRIEVEEIYNRLKAELGNIKTNEKYGGEGWDEHLGRALAENGKYYRPIFENYISQLDVFGDDDLEAIYDFYKSLEIIEYNQKQVLTIRKMKAPGTGISVELSNKPLIKFLFESIKEANVKCKFLLSKLE